MFRSTIKHFTNGTVRYSHLNTLSSMNRAQLYYSTNNKGGKSNTENTTKENTTNDNTNNNNNNENKNTDNTSNTQDKTQDKFSKAKGIFSFVSATVLSGVLITATSGYLLYQFKKDITDQETYELSKVESTILTEFAIPFRNFFDNLFNNLRRYELFDQVFGPAEIHAILPPPLPKGLGREYTLVIDVDALSEISQRDKYPAIYKRAGYDYFLTNLSQHYEVILYSKEIQSGKTEQINFKLDPQHQYFSGQLYGDSGLKERGRYSKHVQMLNRDPAKVILIDSAPQYEHDNVINVGKFHPNQKDTTLVKLLPVLLDIGQKKVTDVREALKPFHKKDSKGQIQDISKSIEEYTQINGKPAGTTGKNKSK